MRKSVRQRKIFWLTISLIVMSIHSSFAQEYTSKPEVYIPSSGSAFHNSFGDSIYRDVVRLAELPPIHVYDPAAKPLNGTPPVIENGPIALVSYQQEEKAETTQESTSTTRDLSWMNDPIFTFGGFFPVDEQTFDRLKLSRLKESLDDLNSRLETASEAPEEAKKLLRIAFERHEQAVVKLDQIDKLRREISVQPEKLKQLQEAMNHPLPEPPGQLKADAPLESHEALLLEHQAHEDRLRKEYDVTESFIEGRSEQISVHAKLENQLNEQLATANENIETHLGSGLLSEATLLENHAIVVAARINLRLLTVEKQWLVATEKSSLLQRDSLKRQLEHAQGISQRLANQVAQRRDELIKAEAKTARREAMDAHHHHPLLRDLAEENAALAEQRTMVSKINRANIAAQQELDDQLKAIKDSRKKLDEHLTAAGHSQAVGLLLRFERTKLPQTSHSRQKIQEIESTLPDLKLERLKINDQLEQISSQQAEIEKSVNELDPMNSRVSAAELSAKASGLLAKKRDYLMELNSDYETYLNGLAKLQQSHEQLLDNTNELRTYIDQHVLWIRSAEPIDSSDFQKSLQALQSIGTSDQWQTMVKFLSTRLNGRWFLIFFLIAGLWLGIGMRQQLDRRLRYVCRRRSEFRVSPLLRSVFLTAFQASLLPALVATLGWLLSSGFGTGTLKDSISRGLLSITPQLFIASFVYRMSIRGGLAETQLGWSRDVCDRIRAASGTIARYCLPLIAITDALEVYEDGYWIDSLGRLVFIASMIVLAITSFRLLRGIGKAWHTDPDSSRSIWEQTFALWSPLVVVAPVALVCVSALGFMYSSMFLGVRLLMTWWLVLGVVAIYYLLRRVVDIGHNIIIARRRWRPNFESEYPDMANRNLTVDNEINAIRSQVTRLLHVASVAICLLVAFSFWDDVLPAVKALDYGLWQVNRQMETLGPDQKTMIAVTKLAWITVGDSLRFIMILLVTFVVSRNIPGLLQMVILDRLPLDRGGKYAISIVCRYLVGALGLILACRMIGFTWTSVQWLVAAMSVGLGFGLQEIFANFIAGIIILLERPIRVGDFVTVNGTAGFVTKIQLRATMIIDYDRRELIVPNKKFITDDVINWTLSDSITRIVIPVGVAYGSDTRLVQSVLLRVARDNSDVLRDPRPVVVFSSFGGSSLDFQLKVHIGNRESYHDILHELHMAIDQEFRKQKIEIAFPQQDIHVRGVEPLVRLAEITQQKKAG